MISNSLETIFIGNVLNPVLDIVGADIFVESGGGDSFVFGVLVDDPSVFLAPYVVFGIISIVIWVEVHVVFQFQNAAGRFGILRFEALGSDRFNYGCFLVNFRLERERGKVAGCCVDVETVYELVVEFGRN